MALPYFSFLNLIFLYLSARSAEILLHPFSFIFPRESRTSFFNPLYNSFFSRAKRVKNDLKFTAYLPVFFRAKRVDVKHVDHHDVKHVDVKHVDVKHRGPNSFLPRIPLLSCVVEHGRVVTGPLRTGQIRCTQVRQVLPPIFQYIYNNYNYVLNSNYKQM